MYRANYISVLGALTALVAVSACGSGGSPAAHTPTVLKFTNPSAATLTAGSPADIGISVTARGAVVRESGRMPDGLSFESKPGVGKALLVGRVGRAAGGRYDLDLTASDAGRRVSQRLIVTVDQSPAFSTGDPGSIVAWTGRKNEAPILATGYPVPTIAEAGQLQQGMSFQSLADGGALISGSPGVFESQCASQVTLIASNGTGVAATMSVTVNLKTVRCALTPSTVLSLIKNAFQIGPKLVIKGKVAGQWIVQKGQRVGQVISRNGKAIGADTDEEAQALEESGALNEE